MKPLQTAIVPRPHVRLQTARIGAGTLGELYRLLVDGGRWWMVPMICVLGGAALLLVAVTAIEYVAPFVYTIF